PAWQQVADQLFQALVRSPANTIDQTLVGSMRDTWERVLASQLLRMQPAPDSLDGMNWGDAETELDWQGVDNRPARSDRNEASRVTLSTSDAQANAARAALDQYFAQTTDDTDQN